jgi:hypothetical protein
MRAIAISIQVTQYKSITHVNGFYTGSEWNKTSSEYGCGNDIPEARNSIGNKNHKKLVTGELFYKNVTHCISSAAVDVDDNNDDGDDTNDDDVIRFIRIGLVGRRCFIATPELL